jgi:uncharacterized protein DUF5652
MTLDLSTGWVIALVIAAVWELVWKGIALWRASKRDEKWWFAGLLVINTVGILPILYLLFARSESKSHAGSFRSHMPQHT